MAVALMILVVLASLLVVASGVWVAIGLIAALVSPKHKEAQRGDSV